MAISVRYAAIAVLIIILPGCSSGDFMVSKNANHFYITSTGAELKHVLCDSGDMDGIARQSNLPEALQKNLKDGICASKKDKERLMTTLGGLTKEQRTALEDAFRQYGYNINGIANDHSLM